MENLGLEVTSRLDTLCKASGTCAEGLQPYLAKQIWNPRDRTALLEVLSEYLARPECSAHVLRSFRPLSLELLQRAEKHVTKNGTIDWLSHQRFCVALSKTLDISDEALRFASEYLSKHEPFYRKNSAANIEPKSKKAKKKLQPPSESELVHATWRCLSHLTEVLRHGWDWSDFLDFLGSGDLDTRWFAAQSIIRLVGLSIQESETFIQNYFTPEKIIKLSAKHVNLEKSLENARMLTNPQRCLVSKCEVVSHTKQEVVEADLGEGVVAVCGVLLRKTVTSKQNNGREAERLVAVPSMESNLRSLALAVSSASPVLLQGPVGCGKTVLVEHLATLTGTAQSEKLLKVQLGDQTDSKALLGTYRCTDVPGEFVWQPGSLTRAVSEGLWIVLEDIDYAPMDVISVLVPLLQSGTLSIPGHGDNITPAPGFRLFATQRLYSSGAALYKNHSASADIVERLWTTITVEPLSRDELKTVIVKRHPQFQTVVDRLLDVYLLLSAGRHGYTLSDNNNDDGDIGKFLSHDGRMISTRDLMKWCGRIAAEFDVTSSATANLVFQEALDCFCSCLAKPANRLPLAAAIGARLNVSKAKAEYYLNTYKPIIEISHKSFTVGRVSLEKKEDEVIRIQREQTARFAFTRASVCLLERVAVCVTKSEPVLLVGETGTGKTSSVQYLAQQMGHKLRVINMNQQSDSTDLLGGFKPIDLRLIIAPVREHFETLFCKTFSRKQNIKFLNHIQECFSKRRWTTLLTLMEHSQRAASKKADAGPDHKAAWDEVGMRLARLRQQIKQSQNTLAFSFIEGSLVQAVRRGEWVLLDEINLASAETLECLSGLLESATGSIVLMERGDTVPIMRHPDFRLFACMNPATDVGKKDLPPGVRNRFTEFYVDELEDAADLRVLVAEYLKGLALTAAQVDGIVQFYLNIRKEAVKKLTDGTGHRPHYSLRTLCRALREAAKNAGGSVARSLYEGFALSFLTELDRSSHPLVENLIASQVVGRTNMKSLLKQPLPPPGDNFNNFEGYWVANGPLEAQAPKDYILTPSVRANLRDLVRVVAAGRHPVLLQGETSVGKTSLITWLAAASGNRCLRINNHEHTDLQEYIGCYAADRMGKLIFKEGVLVEAMKKGHWIILDELNLAPTDVLEALNRLLDDNRELFIAETQEVVKAHPRFMLFATQNPPGLYGGRKILSRAFRNRFVELHFDDIPSGELETILHERCNIPPSYAKRLVAVMLELQMRRRGSGVFAGKQGFITLRDLFRWAERYRRASTEEHEKFFDWDQQLADNGYMLLAGRVRRPEEESVIREVLQKHLRRAVDPARLLNLDGNTSPTTAPLLRQTLEQLPPGFGHVVWTYNMRRMAVLVGQALKFGEPVLLVGETGCGKTTVCQMFAELEKKQLFSVNCHLHTESADFLGGLRPVRQKHEEVEDGVQRLFEWVDGPLVRAMSDGAMFLIDEISLADDSVLERLNSVLELERTLVLAEKGGSDADDDDVDVIKAAEGFRVYATMNPGGDFGKKELSPALRNRFTEIWCPPSRDREDFISIIDHNIRPGLHLPSPHSPRAGFGQAIMDFISWFSQTDFGSRSTVSIRDILSWVTFINTTSRSENVSEDDVSMEQDDDVSGDVAVRLDPLVAYVHGASMVFLDALGSGVTNAGNLKLKEARQECLTYLENQVKVMSGRDLEASDLGFLSHHGNKNAAISRGNVFGIPPFFITRGSTTTTSRDQYALDAPTTSMNAQRLLRALQLPRPLLLEGSPGVGKTSLVSALARASGHSLVRINLSEQTDVSDLFGADLPVEGGEGGQFAWRDGPLLQALRAGDWVVLDEMNLASQSVLEGLNACLDHRAEIYIPELARSFQVRQGQTRIFACQNPLTQGGGRKGLPRSFLNRFTQVYVEPLSRDDLLFITQAMYPALPRHLLENMVDYNQRMHELTVERPTFGQRGGPWEFNLRDVFRWCELITTHQCVGFWEPGEYVDLIYSARLRTLVDKESTKNLYKTMFSGDLEPYTPQGDFHLTSTTLQVGNAFLQRRQKVEEVQGHVEGDLRLLHRCLGPLERLMNVINMGWMAILVGPASSGKTSLVRLLAQLCGHPLQIFPMNSDMDTTELLGGFEQADLRRHLDDAVRTTQTTLHRLVANLLVSKQNPSKVKIKVKKVMATWSKYSSLSGQCRSMTTAEEVAGLKRKVTVIEDLLSQMMKINTDFSLELSDEITSEQKQVELLAGKLERSNSVNHGGQFEWVDSVLVKALRDGHWVLIDNVNFCSPSVLDRLNALLEPGGELTISERGVIDGQVPSIKPHHNFRLILTMDPKYGEISRAMRNRGIEIYMLGEDEDCGYKDDDIASLLSSTHIVGHVIQDLLINIHAKMRADHRATHFTVVDLLRVATMTYQQMQHGADVMTSLRNSCHDVYVKGQTDLKVQEIYSEYITSSLSTFDLCSYEKEHQVSSLLLEGQWPETFPSVRDWSHDHEINHVIHACSPLLHLVDQMLISHTEVKKRALPLSISEILGGPRLQVKDDLLALSEPLIEVLLEAATPSCWRMIPEWLRIQVTRRTGGAISPAISQVAQLLTKVKVGLEAMFESGVSEKVLQERQELSLNEDWSDLRQQPLDLRWNHYHVKRLLIGHLKAGNDVREKLEMLNSATNQLMFLSGIKRRWSVFMKDMEATQIHQLGQLSAVQLSTALHQGGLDLSQLPHPVVAHLRPFFIRLEENLESSLNVPHGITDHSLNQLFERMKWVYRFFTFCHVPMNVRSAETFFPLLALHWNWCQEEALTHVITPERMSQDLLSVIRQLEGDLAIDSKASALQMALSSHLGHPPPYKDPREAETGQKLQRLLPKLQHTVSATAKTYFEERIHCIMNIPPQLLSPYQTEETEKSRADLVLEVLTQFGIPVSDLGHPASEVTMETDTSPPPPPPKISPHTIALWPLYDALSLRAVHHLVAAMVNNGDLDNMRAFLGQVKNYVFSHPTGVPHALLVADLLLQEKKDQAGCLKGHLSELVLGLVTQAMTSTVTYDRKTWLTWRPQSGKEHEEENPDEKCYPESLYSSLLTSVMTGLLVAPSAVSEQTWLPSNIPLGEMTDRMSQLTTLSHVMWVHSGATWTEIFQPNISDQLIAEGCLQRLLMSMTADTTETRNITAITELMEQLHGPKEQLSMVREKELEVLCLDKYSILMAGFGEVFRSTLVAFNDMFLHHQPSDHHDNKHADVSQHAFHNGLALVHVGLLQAFLLAPVGPVDPAEKKAVKLEYLKEELIEIKQEIEVRNRWSYHNKGHTINSKSPDLHPRITWLLHRQCHLEEEINILSEDVAIRPEPSQFPELLKESKSFLTNVLSVENVLSLLEKFRVLYDQPPAGLSRLENVLCEGHAWMSTISEFVKRVQSQHPLYRDLIHPFIAGIALILSGCQMLMFAVEQKSSRHLILPRSLHKQVNPLEEVVILLAQFPTVGTRCSSLVSVARLYIDNVMGTLQHLEDRRTDGSKPQTHRLTPRLLKIALLHIMDHIQISSHVSDETLHVISQVFSLFVTSWQQVEEARRIRQAEKESLYKYKTTTHGEERSEEEMENEEMKRTFPSFDQDFADITAGPTLDDPVMVREDAVDEGSLQWEISQEEVEEVCRAHLTTFLRCGKTHWLPPVSTQKQTCYPSNTMEAALSTYRLATEVIQMSQIQIGYVVDAHLVNTHLLACQALKDSVSEDKLNAMTSERPYDIYRDSNVPEVLKCRPLLTTMRNSVKKLLNEWPEHPTLQQMMVVIERIYSFPVTGPIMKFVTGLEVLLNKAHEWETNAARHVSLKAESETLTQQIIEWRKLELRCWKKCLDTAAWKCRQMASRWWFHLYQLIDSVLHPPPPGEKENEEEKAEPEGVAGLVTPLQQFMEGSSLGEYSVRLELLRAFLGQLTYMDDSTIKDDLTSLIWNIFIYYRQFEAAANAELARKRADIEKQLKGFVKIARWNDINFYSIKQAVEKTHSTLMKHIRSFREVLSQPVTPILTEKPSIGPSQTPGSGDTEMRTVQDELMYSIEKFIPDDHWKNVSNRLPAIDCPLPDLLQQLPSLYTKMCKHCARVLRQSPYHRHVSAIDEFTGEVIEATHDLQREIVIQGPDKEKLLKEAKLLQVKKRKALADLFKYLSRTGLSYRRGLQAQQDTDPNIHLKVAPVNMDCLLKQLQKYRCDEDTLRAWSGVEDYIVRCIARQAVFQTSLKTVSTELGKANLDRCHGFVWDLMGVVYHQREELAKTANTFKDLRCQLWCLEKLVRATKSETEGCLPPQEQAKHWMVRVKSLCEELIVGLHQVGLLVSCCPQEQPATCLPASPLPASHLHPAASLTQRDPAWTDMVTNLQAADQTVQTLKVEVDKMSSQPQDLVTWEEVKFLRETLKSLSTLTPTLQKVEEAFLIQGAPNVGGLAATLHHLHATIIQTNTDFSLWTRERARGPVSEEEQEQVTLQLEELLTQVLVVVQNVVKKRRGEKREEKGEGNGEQKEEEEQQDIEDGLITQVVHRDLKTEIEDLNLDKIYTKLSCILGKVNTWSEADSPASYTLSQTVCRLLIPCVPVLLQYCHLVQAYLTHAVAALRATAKLQSVLLAIFTELTTKGFCLPSELSDEMNKEGATQFEDIENAGMGEGEGVKDVSDQIETEDQLDEARKPGEKEEEKGNQPEVKAEENAIEMEQEFEGKMHDLEPQEGDEDSKDEDEGENDEVDKEMGDLGEQDAERLDEQVWGSDEEDEKEDEVKDTKEEFGPGAGDQTEAEIVAKDDNQDPTKGEEKEKTKEEEEKKEEENEEKINERTDVDEREYDEDEVDPHYGNQEPEKEPEAMDLPDDLNLDEEAEKEEGEDGQENPHDIDKMAEEQMEEGSQDGNQGEEEDKMAEQKEEKPENGGQEEEEEEGKTKEELEEKSENKEEEDMETEEQEEEGAPDNATGLQPQDESEDQDEGSKEEEKKKEETPVGADMTARTTHDTQQVQQIEDMQDHAGHNEEEDQQEAEGTGLSESQQEQGHEGDKTTAVTRGSQQQQRPQQSKRKPGQSHEDRTVGTEDEKVHKRLKTIDRHEADSEQDSESQEKQKSDLYEHIKEATAHHDAQTMDAADADQEQLKPALEELQEEQDEEEGLEDTKPDDEQIDNKQLEDVKKMTSMKLKQMKSEEGGDEEGTGEGEEEEGEKMEVDGEKVETEDVKRPPVSTIHTQAEMYAQSKITEADMEQLRRALEENLDAFRTTATEEVGGEASSAEQMGAAQEAWQQYEAITSTLSQELCEQLRLVLEPTQASKLRGDYRTGKRLNMRKVIPYIASQFRKDKIWLRRTKPSKRQYQVMVAVDDSSSMADNHSKQLAFESLSTVANALTLLEVGELGISSFGECVKVLHPFHEQFSSQAGAKILQQFTFQQTKTKIAQLLGQMSAVMTEARSHQRGASSSHETSQLLLIISDGRGLFLEGMEKVQLAVRQAREANIFTVFVIIDNPDNKDSILDIRVPVFKSGGQMPEIRSYMESFPFPFYLIIRDINQLPVTLSDALRQWFELVTATDL